MTQPFSPDYDDSPWWWRGVRFPPADGDELPESFDVVVIGAGYTGCHAALQTISAGMSTLILEAGPFGHGCSSRNGGHLSTSIKPSQRQLEHRLGLRRAKAIRAEGEAALRYTVDFIRDRSIDCRLEACGRLFAAHSHRQFRRLQEAFSDEPGCRVLKRSELGGEIRTDAYKGGVVVDDVYALQPAEYLAGLLKLVLAGGGRIRDYHPVMSIAGEPGNFRVITESKTLRTRKIILATNGYTGPLSPWQRRRVIPVASSIIATERLGEDRVRQLIPGLRLVIDTRRLLTYYRPSPDHQRILFGGRVSARTLPSGKSALRLHGNLGRLFPDIAGCRIDNGWTGYVAYTFDTLPHIGTRNGIHFAMGYCGSGVSLASYFGCRIGQQAAGSPEGRTALDDLPFPTRPGYLGNPWFLPPVIAFNRFLDRLP